MTKINHQSLPEKTADVLLTLLHQENYTAGQKLPGEPELASRLEVSRYTIRGAIKLLTEREILYVERGAGTFVSGKFGVQADPLGYASIYDKKKLAMDLLQIRLMIEPKTTQLAAQNVRKQDIVKLRQLCKEMETSELTYSVLAEKDMAFHQYIADCSGNSVVYRLIPLIHQMQLLHNYVLPDRNREATHEEHHQIIAAMERHDGAGAADAMRYHLLVIRMRLEQDQVHKR